MRRRAVVTTLLVGASGVAVCVPDIKAYRRLAAVARSVRNMPGAATGQAEPSDGPQAVLP